MKLIFNLVVVVLFCATVRSASVPVPGSCPPVQTTPITNFAKILGLWWRPFRSQFNEEEPLYECLSTDWLNLNYNTTSRTFTFGVVDYNFELENGEDVSWIGEISSVPGDDGDWRILSFTDGNRVNAQILDVIEDTYIYMYVCEENLDDQTHTQNGIIFTRDQIVSSGLMDYYLARAAYQNLINNLNFIEMEAIPLENCEIPNFHGNQ